MSIATMGAKIQAFDIFQTPLSSHYPLHLSFAVLYFNFFNVTVEVVPEWFLYWAKRQVEQRTISATNTAL